jgi:hypothetical protein
VGQAALSPGVAAGDWIRYTVSTSGTSATIDPAIYSMDWFEFVFLEVVDSEVATTFTVHYHNGTEDARQLRWDVLSGEELWLIPAGLQAGDIIPWGYTRINATVNRSYLGAVHSVNLVEFLFTEDDYTEQLWIYWDQTTGLLMELTLEIRDGADLAMYQYLATTRGRTLHLSLSLQLSSSLVIQGDPVTLAIRVTDTDQWPVDNASVQVTYGLTTTLAIGLGNGRYQISVPTSNLTLGHHTLTVWAHHAGYSATESAISLTLLPVQLIVTPELATPRVTQGSSVLISATVTNAMNVSVEGASVNASSSTLSISLIDQGNGTYQGTLATTTLPEGSYSIRITAQKAGYPLAEEETTLVVTPPEVFWFPYLGLTGVILSISVGILHYRRRWRKAPPRVD